MVVLIPAEVNPTWFRSKLSIRWLYFTLTSVEVPIPTDWSEVIFKLTISPTDKLCAVVKDTFEFILSTFPLILLKLDSNLYLK